MRLIEAEKVTYFVGVPLMSFEILTHPDRAQLRPVDASPTSPPAARRARSSTSGGIDEEMPAARRCSAMA